MWYEIDWVIFPGLGRKYNLPSSNGSSKWKEAEQEGSSQDTPGDLTMGQMYPPTVPSQLGIKIEKPRDVSRKVGNGITWENKILVVSVAGTEH